MIRIIKELVAAKADTAIDLAKKIWSYAELAYEETRSAAALIEALEQEGYVYSVPGKGSFAAPGEDIISRRREELFAQLDALAADLRELGVTEEELAARLTRRKEEQK